MLPAISVDKVILLHSLLTARKRRVGLSAPGGLTRPLSLGEEELVNSGNGNICYHCPVTC